MKSNLRFYSIEFISKDGYKSTCIMPAYDENMAKNKFVRLMNLRGDKRPTITKCKDLGLSDEELKKFCEEFSTNEESDMQSKPMNFSQRINFAINIDPIIREIFNPRDWRQGFIYKLHKMCDAKSGPMNGVDFDPAGVTPQFADKFMKMAGSIFGAAIVQVSKNMKTLGGFYGLEPLVYCIKKYPQLIKKYFGVDADWIDIDEMIKYTDVYNMSRESYAPEINYLTECLFYSGERYDYFKKMADILGCRDKLKKAATEAISKLDKQKDNRKFYEKYFDELLVPSGIPYKELQAMSKDQMIDLAKKTVLDTIEILRK